MIDSPRSTAATSTRTRTRTPASAAKLKSAAELARLRQRVNEHAETVLQEKFQSSNLKDSSPNLPQFALDEVVRGKYLGKGFFGVVYEVEGLDGRDQKGKMVLTSQPSSKRRAWFLRRRKNNENHAESEDNDLSNVYESESSGSEAGGDHPLHVPYRNEYASKKVATRKQEAARLFMRNHCQRDNGQSRYAMKILRPEILKDPTKTYYQGVMDLQSETRLLSSIQHPHIIKMRGFAKGGRCHEDYFIVLDRLYDVLEDRLKVWARQLQRNSGLLGKLVLDRKGRKRSHLWQDRIIAAHDLASALAYLHSRRIIHRDLKSDNIGFDIRGDIKIFDFGLARSLPPHDQANLDGAWKMTGSTGTPRYMSPEVAMDKPYNESCDTYSYCMLLWEVLALKTAFELYSMKSFQARVWQGPHKRPPLDPTWPRSLHLVFNRGWSPVLSERQPMSAVAEVLRQEVIKCREDVDEEWGLNVGAERRSTHVFDENDLKNLDFSQKSLFSILSSPFHSKSPFRLGGKKPAVSLSPKKNSEAISPKEHQPYTKVPVHLSTSPTQLDLSGSNDSLSPQRVASCLPTNLPLMLDEDEYEDLEAEVQPQAFDKAEQIVTPFPTTSRNGSAIWERIQEEKARQERIRVRLSATRGVQ